MIIYLDEILILHQDSALLAGLVSQICQLPEALGFLINRKKSLMNPTQQIEFLGFQLCSQTLNENPYSSREAEEDSPGGIPPTPTDNSADKRPGKVYREDFSICQGNPSCTSTLQGLTEAHECRPVTIGGEVQYKGAIITRGQSRSDGVVRTLPTIQWGPNHPSTSESSNRVGCIQHGLGSHGWPHPDRWAVVSRRGSSPHKFLGTVSSVPCLENFCLGAQSVPNPVQKRQNFGCDLSQPERWGAFQSPLQPGSRDLELVSRQRDNFDSRTTPRKGQSSSRPGVQNMSRPKRLEAQPTGVPKNPAPDGPPGGDLFASQLPRFYSWCPDPEAEAIDAFTQNWALNRGYANPPWCLISRCLAQVKQQQAKIVLLTPWWTTQPWFPVVLEMLEDLPCLLPNIPDLVTLPAGKQFIMAQGAPWLIA